MRYVTQCNTYGKDTSKLSPIAFVSFCLLVCWLVMLLAELCKGLRTHFYEAVSEIINVKNYSSGSRDQQGGGVVG